MSEIKQISINGQTIGITGLKDVMDELADKAGSPDDDRVSQYMIEKLSVTNYIPSHVYDQYKYAFLMEYKKYMGEGITHDPEKGLQIKVLGAGCPRCEHLTREVMAVLETEGVQAGLEHVRGIQEIQSYGVQGTPALVINGVVKHIGSVPSRVSLSRWIREYAGSSDS